MTEGHNCLFTGQAVVLSIITSWYPQHAVVKEASANQCEVSERLASYLLLFRFPQPTFLPGWVMRLTRYLCCPGWLQCGMWLQSSCWLQDVCCIDPVNWFIMYACMNVWKTFKWPVKRKNIYPTLPVLHIIVKVKTNGIRYNSKMLFSYSKN